MSLERKEVAKHILVPDTNILWHEDKAHCVSPDFDTFLEKNTGKYQIDLYVPEVVIGELQFQQTTSALKALSKANSEFRRVSEIADNQYSHRIAERRVRHDVEKKLQRWIQKSGCVIQPPPIKSIDWDTLIKDAIWRQPPFTEDKGQEKGFRDALIVQTLGKIIGDHSSNDIAFISGDSLVRQAASSKFGTTFIAYETLEELESFLTLTDNKLTNEFVRAIQARAREKFYSDKSPQSLLFRGDLVRKIKKRFYENFSDPKLPSNAGLLEGLGLLSSKNKWESAGKETFWIQAPQFITLKNVNEYWWRSKIIFAQQFQHLASASGVLLTEKSAHGDLRLRKVSCPVIWVAKVAKNGRFMSLDFNNFEDPEVIFTEITKADSEKYDIPW